MCGIVAVIHKRSEENCSKQGCLNAFLQAYETLKHRGPDSSGYVELNVESSVSVHGWLGAHRLAMIGKDDQPLHDENRRALLVANCELYNYYAELRRHASTASDTRILLERILRAFDEHPRDSSVLFRVIQELDGVFSFIVVIDKQLIAARDYWGVKPLYIGMRGNDELALASEIKALMKLNVDSVSRFQPGSLAIIDLDSFFGEFLNVKRHRFNPTRYQQGLELAQASLSFTDAIDILHRLLVNSIKKRIEFLDSVAILLSGGLDSSILAVLLDELTKSQEIMVRGFVVGEKSSKDILFTELLESYLNFPITQVFPSERELEEIFLSVSQAIEMQDLKQLTIALPLALACQEVKKHRIRALITGQGADELFGGYHRYREAFLMSPTAAKEEMERDLLEFAKKNLERDDKVAMHYGLELRLPYLDLELSGFARHIPVDWKLQIRPSTSNCTSQLNEPFLPSHVRTKVILRELARKLGLPEVIAERKKTAIQYGSNVMKILRRFVKRQGYKKLKEWFEEMMVTVD